MRYALERARTAREAVELMGRLIDEYGYGDEGESLSIADTQEAWIMEMVGQAKGARGRPGSPFGFPTGSFMPRQLGPHRRVSSQRPGQLPLFRERREFRHEQRLVRSEIGPAVPLLRRLLPRDARVAAVLRSRVWSVLRGRRRPQHLPPDYHRSKPGSQPYPLSLPPDGKLSAADVFALDARSLRGNGVRHDAGRGRGPLRVALSLAAVAWKVDGVEYAWERPISTPAGGLHVRVAVAGVAARSRWRPVLVRRGRSLHLLLRSALLRHRRLAQEFHRRVGSKFSWDSAWWVFNIVSNYAYLKYSYMMPEIRACQKDIESNFLALQPAVEKTAVELSRPAPTCHALPYRLFRDARRADRRPLAGAGRAPVHEIQRRLRSRH